MKTNRNLFRKALFVFFASFCIIGITAGTSSTNWTIDEEIFVSAHVTVLPNTVAINISRTGPDAGLYPGCVIFTILFNEGYGSAYEQEMTYRHPFEFGTWYNGAVAGPIPSLDARVIDVQMDYNDPECHH